MIRKCSRCNSELVKGKCLICFKPKPPKKSIIDIVKDIDKITDRNIEQSFPTKKDLEKD